MGFVLRMKKDSDEFVSSLLQDIMMTSKGERQ